MTESSLHKATEGDRFTKVVTEQPSTETNARGMLEGVLTEQWKKDVIRTGVHQKENNEKERDSPLRP